MYFVDMKYFTTHNVYCKLSLISNEVKVLVSEKKTHYLIELTQQTFHVPEKKRNSQLLNDTKIHYLAIYILKTQ